MSYRSPSRYMEGQPKSRLYRSTVTGPEALESAFQFDTSGRSRDRPAEYLAVQEAQPLPPARGNYSLEN